MKDLPKLKNQNKNNGKKVCVIGSGVAGLAVSIRLALQGWQVSIFEMNSVSGGKMVEWHKDGFRFDLGPSVFTMPEYVEDLFHLSGKNPKDYIQINRPELPFNYFFEDGLMLNFYADTKKLVQEIASKTVDDEATINKYLEDVAIKYQLTEKVFLQQSLHILSNYWSKDVLKGLVNFHKVEVFKSMNEANKKNFKDEHNVRLFNSVASYLGSSPYKAPGVLKVISHFQLNNGIFLPKGGMFAVAKSLTKLAEDLGVKIYYNSPVTKILIKQKQAVGVQIGSEKIESDLVISNLDVFNTYKKLLPAQNAPKIFLDRQKSHSALVFLWAVRKKFPQLALHNMILSEDMQNEYGTIFENADVGDDFTVYLYISSKCNQGDAPEGCENWYILINAPHLHKDQNWDKMISRVRTKLLQRLERVFGENIEPHIAFERVQDPRTFEQHTGAAFGAIYGNSSNGKFAVFLRHPNFTSKIKQLYFCGGYRPSWSRSSTFLFIC